jgi:hypothetical protein
LFLSLRIESTIFDKGDDVVFGDFLANLIPLVRRLLLFPEQLHRPVFPLLELHL